MRYIKAIVLSIVILSSLFTVGYASNLPLLSDNILEKLGKANEAAYVWSQKVQKGKQYLESQEHHDRTTMFDKLVRAINHQDFKIYQGKIYKVLFGIQKINSNKYMLSIPENELYILQTFHMILHEKPLFSDELISLRKNFEAHYQKLASFSKLEKDPIKFLLEGENLMETLLLDQTYLYGGKIPLDRMRALCTCLMIQRPQEKEVYERILKLREAQGIFYEKYNANYFKGTSLFKNYHEIEQHMAKHVLEHKAYVPEGALDFWTSQLNKRIWNNNIRILRDYTDAALDTFDVYTQTMLGIPFMSESMRLDIRDYHEFKSQAQHQNPYAVGRMIDLYDLFMLKHNGSTEWKEETLRDLLLIDHYRSPLSKENLEYFKNYMKQKQVNLSLLTEEIEQGHALLLLILKESENNPQYLGSQCLCMALRGLTKGTFYIDFNDEKWVKQFVSDYKDTKLQKQMLTYALLVNPKTYGFLGGSEFIHENNTNQ